MTTRTTRTFLGIAALAIGLVATTDGSAQSRASKTLDVRVGSYSIEQGRVNAALLSGEQQGILPGDKGFFTKNGQKVPGSDFEVNKIGGRVAWTVTSFPTPDTLRFKTSLTARITTPIRVCTSKGTKVAVVMSARKESDTSIYFTIDKGTQDGVMPSSVIAGPGEGATELTWVTPTAAGGYVRGVSNPEEVATAFRKTAFESITCKTK